MHWSDPKLKLKLMKHCTCCTLPTLQVYGPIAPTAPNDATKFNSMAVVAPAANEWLVLQLLNGAAECLLPDAESFGKCSL